MPLMTQIRERMSTFFSVFAGLFVVYIVLDWGMDITGRKHADRNREAQDVGRINDQSITFTEFSTMVRQAAENQKQQSGIEPDENQIRLIRDQVWNQLVDQQIYDAEIERLGISVPDKEILDWVTGENPPEYLRQQFTDSTGKFDRDRYDATLRDPKNKPIMVRVEDALRKQRQREKLQSLVLATVQVPEGDVLRRFTDQNIKYEGDFILIDPNILVKDEDVKVTDDDLRRFYNDHAEEFKTEATRKLKYVQFSEVASKSDTASIVSDLADIARRASEGADFTDLAKTYSETPVSDVFLKHGELSPEKEKAVFAAKAGQVVGPLKEADGFHLIKVAEFRDGTTEYLHAAHVLINIENNDSVSALKKAKEVAAKARSGANFSELAAQFSQEAGAAERGGDLGWFGKGRMVKPFEDAAFKASAGQIVGPIRTQFGYHVIRVIAKDKREVKIIDIHMPVHVSLQTQNDLTQNAEDIAFAAKEGDFLKVAAEKGLASTPVL